MAIRRSSLLSLLLLLLLFPSAGSTQAVPAHRFKTSPGLAIADLGSWKVIQPGVEFRKVTLERAESRHQFELKLVRFDLHRILPRIVPSRQYNLKSADVRTLAEKSGALAMINANYFDEKGMPLGFLKTEGEANLNVSKSPLFTGIFAIKDHAPFIAHRDEFLLHQADEGLQAGPLLLAKGSALTVTRGADRQFRRSLIGLDPGGRLIAAVTDTLFGGLTWTELQEFFGASEWQAQTSDLLNLDGGGSTQLHLKAARFEQYVPGTAEVPVGIGFFPVK